MRLSALVSWLIVLASCVSSCSQNDKTGIADEPVRDVKDDQDASALFSPAKKLGRLESKKLSEVSGLAASIANPGMLWTLNDSNNPAEVFLIDLQTNIRQTYELKHIVNRDWEEIAVGPGPEQGEQYVYVGDIGDNAAAHEVKYIYRFKEPRYNPNAGKSRTEIVDFDTIAFSLSDERRDTEAFFVEPGTRDIYIISKWKNAVDVYRIKYSDNVNDMKAAQLVGKLPISMVVACNMSKDGTELLVKSYKGIYYWKRPANLPVMEMLEKPAIRLPYEEEPQGEAIAWAIDGKGYYTLSEKKKKDTVHLLFYERN